MNPWKKRRVLSSQPRRIAAWIFIFLCGINPAQVWGGGGSQMEKATFGAGCFWGVEKVFGEQKGVVSTQVGYLGGNLPNPTYEDVCTGNTGHAEAIEITYDPAKINYENLLEVFWSNHDPTTLDRQGPDVGTQYRSAIFYHTPAQKAAAEKSKELLDKANVFRHKIVTEIVPASTFYRAEEYHQKYLKKNPHGYCSLQRQPAKVREVLRAARPVA